MRLVGTTLIANNILYENIIKLHLSSAVVGDNITIVNNIARYLFMDYMYF